MNLAYNTWQRVSRRQPCPICHKFDFCEISHDTQTVHCMRLESDRPTAYRQGGWLHTIGVPFITQKPHLVQSTDKLALAGVAIRHKAITYLLAKLQLSKAHENYLLTQDFSRSEMIELGYRTLPQENRSELARKLVELLGDEQAAGLAFLYPKKGRNNSRYFQFAAARADLLLIPIKNLQGQYLGLKARWETPQRQYRILSSGNIGGASLGTPLHVARPSQVLDPSHIIVTEGEKKADYIALKTNSICIGVQGTGNWRAGGNANHLATVLLAAGAKTVEVAFDADLATNPRVARDLYTMSCQLQAAGFEVIQRLWPLEAAKGYDDLLRLDKAALSWLEPFSPKLENTNTNRWVKKFVELDPETLAAHRHLQNKTLTPLLTVEEARNAHANLFQQAFAEHFFTLGKQRHSLVVTSNPGTGKSHAALAQALEAIKNYPAGRILYVADTKEVYRQWLQPDALLYDAWQAGLVAIREGRQAKPGEFECRRLNECNAAGKQRHAPTWDVCSTCPFFNLKNWQSHLTTNQLPPQTPMTWQCQTNGYWNGVEKANQARLVLAPKASFFNNSHELAEFDIIIIDESIVEHLLERIDLSRETLATWREAIARQNQAEANDYNDFLTLFGLIEQALNTQLELLTTDKPNTRQQLTTFLPTLKEVATQKGLDLANLLDQCLSVTTHPKTNRYAWERPLLQLDSKLSFPLHFAHELITALALELAHNQRDTRLWFNNKELSLAVFAPRQHLLEMLKGQPTDYKNSFSQPPSIIILDATPSPLLLDRIMNQDCRVVNYEVAQHVEVTQTTNSLYTKDELIARNGQGLGQVSRLLEKEIAHYDSAAIFCHKTFNPTVGDDELKLKAASANCAVTWGHFDRDNKALNSLSKVDFIAIVGHYCHPLDSLRAQVQALRFGNSTHDMAFDNQSLWKLRTYDWANETNRGIARRCRTDNDKEVQALIEHGEQATIVQAIGRGRPTLRDPQKPLKVLLITAIPINVPIKRLAEAKELLEENTLSLAQAQALATGRALRLKQNQVRQSDISLKIQAGLATIAQTNEPTYLTPIETAQITKVTVWHLGIFDLAKNIWTGEANKRILGPELFIYFYKRYRYANGFVKLTTHRNLSRKKLSLPVVTEPSITIP